MAINRPAAIERLARSASLFGSNAAAGVLDLVYAPRCLVCDRTDVPPLCEQCADSFVPLPEPLCALCGHAVEPGSSAACRVCAAAEAAHGAWAFERAVTAAVFEGPMRHAVHQLKYAAAEELGLPLGAYLANRIVVDALLPPALIAGIDAVVAVPMHPVRERRRGFNQARLLAAPIAEMLDLPLVASSAVRRARHRKAQVGLSPADRRRNIAGLFRVDDKHRNDIAGRSLLLIDDVFTTGATVHSCATALREAGVASVVVATLAGGG